MVEDPLEEPARNRDHHRERGDDPRRPARGQRILEQQTCRQRHLARSIRRFVLDDLSLATLDLVWLRGSRFGQFRVTYLRDGASIDTSSPGAPDHSPIPCASAACCSCSCIAWRSSSVKWGLDVEINPVDLSGDGERVMSESEGSPAAG